ncbi:unnamed protein product [Bursaphelenchus okinawaensis]|uniref:TPR_REGION domain-containing protein n=1 Tax=Bursaphelenchus okinawaensis TaxID=465554 RepID=A0A811LE34_9BILA|nr:unnamed protein product [Bursaphelenchus okinawaensis]CAG9122182.1 unnamed protein product [Bursaphelenchus okinawaensis]
MFRRVLQSTAKLAAGAGALQLGAAGVALTDKQLGKKPEWYQNSVRSLEESLKKLGKLGYIESEEVLGAAEDVFNRVADLDNPHVLWRLGRTYAEKAENVHDHKKKVELLKKAVEYTNKAIQLEGATGISGAHKWYAISATRLLHADKKAVKDPKKTKEQVWAHLKRATELAPNDYYALQLLGAAYIEQKEYKDALTVLRKANELKPDFAPGLYYLGEALRLTKNNSEAVEVLKKALTVHSKNRYDRQAKSDAKKILVSKLKQKPEEVDPKDD